MTYRWYALQIATNYEKKVADQLKTRFERAQITDRLGQILLPTEQELVLQKGQKRVVERKLFPGYLFVQISTEDQGKPVIDQEAWHLVKTTEKVQGFIGGTPDSPKPLSDYEMQKYLNPEVIQATPKTKIQVGQNVRVVDGPFKDFLGVVQSVDLDKAQAEVAVQVFGRPTSVSFSLNHLILEQAS